MKRNIKDMPSYEEIYKHFYSDEETGKIYNKITRQSSVIDAEIGCFDASTGYLVVGFNKKIYYAHHIVWVLHHKKWPEHQIDHIDRHKTNNKINNLRDVPQAENCKNKSIRSNNTSGITGVCYVKEIKKWQARINSNGKTVNLGYFTSLFEACCARKSAEIECGYFAGGVS